MRSSQILSLGNTLWLEKKFFAYKYATLAASPSSLGCPFSSRVNKKDLEVKTAKSNGLGSTAARFQA